MDTILVHYGSMEDEVALLQEVRDFTICSIDELRVAVEKLRTGWMGAAGDAAYEACQSLLLSECDRIEELQAAAVLLEKAKEEFDNQDRNGMKPAAIPE